VGSEDELSVRVLVLGVPRAGKTTFATELSKSLSIPCFHTDDLRHLDWSLASEIVVEWIERPSPWIIEGVAAVRGLRKWLQKHPGQVPCDKLYNLLVPYHPLTAGQESMAKGCKTIYQEIRPLLHRLEIQPQTFDRAGE
jgi:hypothetical protein